MPQRKVVFHQDGYYHVYNRGVNRQNIFRSGENYRYLIRTMNRVKPDSIILLAFCLMPNHYHFLIRQESEEPAHVFLQALFNVYTKAFNRMHRRTGTLFEDRFRAVEITEDRHLLHLCRYIHLNPVQAGLVSRAEEWEFSDYREWVGQSSACAGHLRISRSAGHLQGARHLPLKVPGTSITFLKENFQTPVQYRQFVEEWDGSKADGFEALIFREE